MTVHPFPTSHNGPVPVGLSAKLDDAARKALTLLDDPRLRKDDGTWEAVAHEVSIVPFPTEANPAEVFFVTTVTVGVEDGEEFMYVTHRLDSPWAPDEQVAKAVTMMVTTLLEVRQAQRQTTSAPAPAEPSGEPPEPEGLTT